MQQRNFQEGSAGNWTVLCILLQFLEGRDIRKTQPNQDPVVVIGFKDSITQSHFSACAGLVVIHLGHEFSEKPLQCASRQSPNQGLF